jgi:hypothetical protein
MPASQKPATSRGDDHRSIHSESNDGRTSSRRDALNLGGIGAPGEVLMPNLPARMEQGDALPRQWILGVCDIRLELIAWSATQANVF